MDHLESTLGQIDLLFDDVILYNYPYYLQMISLNPYCLSSFPLTYPIFFFHHFPLSGLTSDSSRFLWLCFDPIDWIMLSLLWLVSLLGGGCWLPCAWHGAVDLVQLIWLADLDHCFLDIWRPMDRIFWWPIDGIFWQTMDGSVDHQLFVLILILFLFS